MLKSFLVVLSILGFQIDYGGDVLERLQTFHYLKQSEQEFVIPDVCISACTMFLGLPKVCIPEGTVFGFHSAYYFDGKDYIPSKFGNDLMMSLYPPKIREYVAKNKMLDSIDLTFVSANTMYSLGMKRCQ